MKVYPLHIIITLCTLLSSMMFVDSLWGQSLGDYLARYEIGFGAEKTIAEEFSLFNGGRVPNRTVRTVAYAGSLSIGIHIPLLTFGDQFGVGINPDIQLALGSAPYDPAFPEEIDHLDASSGIFRLTFPTLLSLKYGTDATMDPDTDMGFGLGLGYRPTFNLPLGYSYGEPIAMGEFSFIAGSALVKARITLPLAVGSPVDEVDLKTYDFSLYFLPGR
ncbi:MAG: hypothetical protein KDD67_00595 [Ignavibacteriae bacterium]|nr:hypothetical protein [Ignavibacteriota bacterium]MCB9214664.1 hypothetical protein [Ignavibacteria bacterium]